MKARTVVSILILLLVIMIVAGSCATDKLTTKQSEILYGTWINEDYNGMHEYSAKLIFEPDSTLYMYYDMSNPKPSFEGRFVITQKWTDSEGYSWYKVEGYFGFHYEGKKANEYWLIRIAKSGTNMEWSYTKDDYPNEINLNRGHYRVLYRQE